MDPSKNQSVPSPNDKACCAIDCTEVKDQDCGANNSVRTQDDVFPTELVQDITECCKTTTTCDEVGISRLLFSLSLSLSLSNNNK